MMYIKRLKSFAHLFTKIPILWLKNKLMRPSTFSCFRKSGFVKLRNHVIKFQQCWNMIAGNHIFSRLFLLSMQPTCSQSYNNVVGTAMSMTLILKADIYEKTKRSKCKKN